MEKALLDVGMTRVRIVALLLYAVLVLLLIFIFIFVGVAAFTGTGTGVCWGTQEGGRSVAWKGLFYGGGYGRLLPPASKAGAEHWHR